MVDKGKEIQPVTTHTEAMVERFNKAMGEIPDAGTTGVEGIVAQIMSVENVAQLGSAWESENTKALVGKVVQITGLSKMESDLPEGLPYFLIVQYLDTETGEVGTFTTGTVSVVAQLAKAYAEGWLPLDCRVEQSKRPTKDGYYPLHLKVLGLSF